MNKTRKQNNNNRSQQISGMAKRQNWFLSIISSLMYFFVLIIALLLFLLLFLVFVHSLLLLRLRLTSWQQLAICGNWRNRRVELGRNNKEKKNMLNTHSVCCMLYMLCLFVRNEFNCTTTEISPTLLLNELHSFDTYIQLKKKKMN